MQEIFRPSGEKEEEDLAPLPREGEDLGSVRGAAGGAPEADP